MNVIFYFNNNELFFDAKEMNDSHHAADYTIEKATNISLVFTYQGSNSWTTQSVISFKTNIGVYI